MMLPTLVPLATKIANLRYIEGSKGYFLSYMGFVYKIDDIYQNSVVLTPKKPSFQRNGYCNTSVYFYDESISPSITLHTAIMKAYRGEPPFMAQVHHIDHHRWNNALTNLKYVSPEVHYDLHREKEKYNRDEEMTLFLEWWNLWYNENLEIFF